MNKIKLSGTIVSEPVFTHEIYGERFYEFQVQSERQSGTIDTLNVMASETLLRANGDNVKIIGEVRTFNIHEEDRNRLHIYVFARDVIDYEEHEENEENYVELDGFICKPPAYRQTPLGREIADVLIACNRPYGKSDYIPTIAWGRNARRVGNMEVGTHIRVEGRMQSREYLKQYGDDTCVDKVAYELSASRIEEVREEE